MRTTGIPIYGLTPFRSDHVRLACEDKNAHGLGVGIAFRSFRCFGTESCYWNQQQDSEESEDAFHASRERYKPLVRKAIDWPHKKEIRRQAIILVSPTSAKRKVNRTRLSHEPRRTLAGHSP